MSRKKRKPRLSESFTIEVMVGNTIVFDDQVYRCVELAPYVNKQGKDTTLAVWASPCAECGAAFEVRTGTKITQFRPSRRCAEHKRPLVRVNVPGANAEEAKAEAEMSDDDVFA